MPHEVGQFGPQYAQAIRDMLVENGLLNLDYTPNLETAVRLGWRLDTLPGWQQSRRNAKPSP